MRRHSSPSAVTGLSRITAIAAVWVIVLAMCLGAQLTAAQTPDSSAGGQAVTPTWARVGGATRDTTADYIVFSPDFATDGVAFAWSLQHDLWPKNPVIWQGTGGAASWQAVNALPLVVQINTVLALPRVGSEQVLLAGTKGAGIYRSTNGGLCWATANSGLTDLVVTALALAPSVGGQPEVLAGTDRAGVFRSLDGGATWQAYNTGLAVPAIKRFAFSPGWPADKRIFAANGEEAIYTLSANGWYRVDLYGRGAFGDVAISPNYAQDHTVFAASRGTNGSVYRSTDSGAHWQALVTGSHDVDWVRVSPSYGVDHTIMARIDGVVQVSSDSGAHWSAFSPAPSGACTDLQFAPNYAGSHLLLTVCDGAVYRLVVGDEFWHLAAHDLAVPEQMRRLLVSPDYDRDGTLLSTGPSVMQRSADRGASWAELPGGMTTPAAFSPAYATDHTIYAMRYSQQFGIFFFYSSTDSGASWTQLPAPVLRNNYYYSALALSPDFANDGTMFLSETGTPLWRSLDRGQTWGNVNKPNGDWYQQITFSPDYAHDRTLWVTRRGRPLRSTDSGATWQDRYANLPFNWEDVVTAFPLSPDYAHDQTLFIVLSLSGVYRSTTAGQSWTPVTVAPGLTVTDLVFAPDYAVSHTLYASTQGGAGVYRSTDGGNTWTPFAAGLGTCYVDSLALSRGERWDLFASTADGLWRITLRGQEETPTPTSSPTPIPEPTVTDTPEPTFTPTPTQTVLPTITPTWTVLPSITPTRTATPTLPCATATATVPCGPATVTPTATPRPERLIHLPLVLRFAE